MKKNAVNPILRTKEYHRMPRLNAYKIKQLCEAKKLSYAKLADQLGLDRSSVSNWVLGKNFPTEENLSKLADALDSEPEELLEKENSEVVVQSPNNNISVIHHNNTIIINNFIFGDNPEQTGKTIQKIITDAVNGNMNADER